MKCYVCDSVEVVRQFSNEIPICDWCVFYHKLVDRKLVNRIEENKIEHADGDIKPTARELRRTLGWPLGVVDDDALDVPN